MGGLKVTDTYYVTDSEGNVSKRFISMCANPFVSFKASFGAGGGEVFEWVSSHVLENKTKNASVCISLSSEPNQLRSVLSGESAVKFRKMQTVAVYYPLYA